MIPRFRFIVRSDGNLVRSASPISLRAKT